MLVWRSLRPPLRLAPVEVAAEAALAAEEVAAEAALAAAELAAAELGAAEPAAAELGAAELGAAEPAVVASFDPLIRPTPARRSRRISQSAIPARSGTGSITDASRGIAKSCQIPI